MHIRSLMATWQKHVLERLDLIVTVLSVAKDTRELKQILPSLVLIRETGVTMFLRYAKVM